MKFLVEPLLGPGPGATRTQLAEQSEGASDQAPRAARQPREGHRQQRGTEQWTGRSLTWSLFADFRCLPPGTRVAIQLICHHPQPFGQQQEQGQSDEGLVEERSKLRSPRGRKG